MNLEAKIEKDFSCQRCNECCRRPGFVYLKDGEAERMARHLTMPLYDFTDQYCDVIDRRRLVLKKLTDETCVMLENNGCKVHPAKPEQCREFPYRWHTPASWEYCEGLKALTELK